MNQVARAWAAYPNPALPRPLAAAQQQASGDEADPTCFKAYLQRYQLFVRKGMRLMDAGRARIAGHEPGHGDDRVFLETTVNLAMAHFASAAQDWVMLHACHGRRT